MGRLMQRKGMPFKGHKTDPNTLFGQLCRYTIVGFIAFVFDFGTLYGLTHFLGVHYLLSAAAAFVLGLSVNYTLSIKWVFSRRTVRNGSAEFLIFALVGAAGLGLNELFIWLFTEIAHFHYLVSKIISTIFVYLWNFFARKYALFN
jgi:putative flippase GtrA